MMKLLQKLTLGLCVLSILSGCATVGSAGDPMVKQQFANETRTDAKTRKRNTWLTIGGIVLLGAIVAHEGQDGARDALRDAERP